jgi:polar amino acid transport system substrate-binding protein
MPADPAEVVAPLLQEMTQVLCRQRTFFMRASWLPSAFLLLGLAAAPAMGQTCKPEIMDSDLVTPGKLQMSINPTLPPQQFVDAKGELQGLNVELMKEIAKRLCVPLEFVRMDFPPMIPALTAGRFDGIDTGMFWTEERSKIAYTVPYAQQTISIIVAKGAPKVASVEGAGGHKAGVEVNSYQERWLRSANKEATAKGAKPVEILTFTTATDVVAALRAGQIESAFLIDQTAREIERRGVVEITATGLGGAPTTMMFRNKTAATKVAATLTAMKADGTYDKLFDRFGITKADGSVFAIRGPGPQ